MSRLVRLTDEQWARIAAWLPSATRTGGRNAKPHRPMVEAMLWILRTGAPWRDLPRCYGPWQSVYTRFARWSASGVFFWLFEALARERDGESYLIDATIPSNPTRAGLRKYDRDLYGSRCLVEHFFQKIKRLRRIAMRFEKLARNFLAFLHIAAALVWLR